VAPRQRDSAAIFARRTAAAKARGWSSYGQRRYWESRWSPEVAKRLAELCCDGHKEDERAGSLLCRECNLEVNPNVKDKSQPDAKPRGRTDWRARLVHLAAERMAERRAGAAA
jgi:hypothetical protein